MTPYIGVTGFMSREEVKTALAAAPHGCHRRLMVGVLASEKTLRYETNKYPRRYPSCLDIHKIFVDDSRALNLVHYATRSIGPTDELYRQMYRAMEFGGPDCHGIQLNVSTPPREDDILRFRGSYPDAVVVCQWRWGWGWGEQLPWMSTPENFSGVLIDASGGRGVLFDEQQVRSDLARVTPCWDVGIGIAGGLCAESLELVRPLLAEWPELSIDAEGKLRTPADDLNIEAMKAYLRAAFEMVGT